MGSFKNSEDFCDASPSLSFKMYLFTYKRELEHHSGKYNAKDQLEISCLGDQFSIHYATSLAVLPSLTWYLKERETLPGEVKSHRPGMKAQRSTGGKKNE